MLPAPTPTTPRVDFQAPCRTNKYPREIPQLPWYRTAAPQMVMAGFLPFSAIYVELYYIFASVWGHKVCSGTHMLRTCCACPGDRLQQQQLQLAFGRSAWLRQICM